MLRRLTGILIACAAGPLLLWGVVAYRDHAQRVEAARDARIAAKDSTIAALQARSARVDTLRLAADVVYRADRRSVLEALQPETPGGAPPATIPSAPVIRYIRSTDSVRVLDSLALRLRDSTIRTQAGEISDLKARPIGVARRFVTGVAGGYDAWNGVPVGMLDAELRLIGPISLRGILQASPTSAAPGAPRGLRTAASVVLHYTF